MSMAIAIACFFLSGVAGLIYEICWIRRSTLVFGSTTLAVSTVLAVFFLGLALGSWSFGRLSRRSSRPLKIYALLEVGVAVLAIASLPLFDLVDPIYGAAYRAFGPESPWLSIARIGLISVILLPPTIAMGGTLPLFVQQFAASNHRIAGSVGLLYGINTLGAALGCALTGLALIPQIGLQKAILLGTLLNLVAGSLVGALRIPPLANTAAERKLEAPSDRRARTVAALVFLAGFVALGQEVLWTRFLGLVMRNTVYTYTITLTVVLVGIVLGSWIASRLFDARLPRAAIFGTLQVLVGLSVLALMLMPPNVWGHVGDLALYCALLMPPAILSGASFPLAVRMTVDDPSLAGFGVGRIAAFNTLGGIAGAFAIGFGALPHLGLQTSVLLTTAVSLAIGFAAWLMLARSGSWILRFGAVAVSVALWLSIPRVTHTRIPADYLANGGELVDFREGLMSNVAVVRRESALTLEIDRLWQGRTMKSHQIMAAHLPMLLHPHPRRVMVVGIGAGQTPGRFLMYGIDRLDCVDIEPALFDLIRTRFPTEWMNDRRVRLVRADGRNVITHTAAKYDVISLEVGQIFRPGVGAFYTEDFYRIARARLEPNGLLSQFVPLSFLSPATFRSVVRTFRQVFPTSALWYNTSELLLIGANGDRLELGDDRLRLLGSDPAIHDDLRYGPWGGPAEWLNQPRMVLGGFLAGAHGLAALAEGGSIYRDDRPVLEYATTAIDLSQPTELPNLRILRMHLDTPQVVKPDLPADSAAAIVAIRERNLADIVTRSALDRVTDVKGESNHAAVVAMLTDAMRANPDNAEAQRVLGDALLSLGRLDEARVHFERALGLKDDPLSHRGLGFTLHRQGHVPEAIAQYRAALDLGADEAEVHNNLGAALGQQGDLQGALRHFSRAVELRPDFKEARDNLERVRAALAAKPR